MVALVLVQFSLYHYHRWCFVLGLTTMRDSLMGTVSGRENEPPWYRHDNNDVVQAHVRHVHQIYREDLVAYLKENQIFFLYTAYLTTYIRVEFVPVETVKYDSKLTRRIVYYRRDAYEK